MNHTSGLKEIHLPQLKEESLVTCYAQQRPRRNGGYRIQKVNRGDKTIIHNYGHGGAGVSLAPGSGAVAVSLASQILNENQETPIAVIGSGIIGLFTCYQLLKQFPNRKIKIYAERFPIFGEKNNEKLITSQVAPGFWMPFHYGSDNDVTNQKVTSISFNEYSSLAQKEPYRSMIKDVDVYDISDDKQIQEEYSNSLPKEVEHTYHQTTVNLNGRNLVCRTFKAMKIDMQPFLNAFISELTAKGVDFVTAKLDEKGIDELPERVIFNCTGLASRQLFKDENIKGVKGHLAEYRNPKPEIYNCIITANIGKQVVDYYMHDSRIILGLTEQDVDNCVVDYNQIKMLQETHQMVLQKYGISPSSSL